MSGHSHAKNIAHQKAATDQKRGQAFSKLVRLITIAVREGGSNPETNSKLRTALDRAKYFNLPGDNIERAIKQASGGLAGKELNEFAFEAFGPAGIALIIEGITDNKNRILGEIKQILNQHAGKLAQEGSVRWLFERRGAIGADLSEQAGAENKESLESKAIEAGADDLWWSDNFLEIQVKPENLQSLKSALEASGVKISSASIDWIAKEEVVVEEKDRVLAEKLLSRLDQNPDVQDVFSNLKE